MSLNSIRKTIKPILDKRNDRMYVIDQYKVEPSTNNDFIFTINTALGTGNSFQLPLPNGQIYDFIVNWGDGNSDTITAYNQTETLHAYSSGGIYQISITGKCGGWSFNNAGDKLKITSVDQWGDVGFDSLAEGFWGCANLSSLPVTAIKPTPNLVNYNNTFQDCDSLTSIPALIFSESPNVLQFIATFAQSSGITTVPTDLFRYNTSVLIMNSVFSGCINLASIPSDLFRYNTAVVQFNQTFQTCYGLSSLPEDLFYYNSSVTSYFYTFYLCRNIALPTRLFNLSNLSIVNTFQQFMSAASTVYSNTGTVQDIWNYATSATSTDAFKNQTAISNYADIPFEWKGMVEVGTLTTDQSTLQQVGISRTYTGIAEINWGDGTFTRTTSGVEAFKDYAVTGIYEIKLGAATATSTTQLVVDNSRLIDVVSLKTGLLTNLRLQQNLLSSLDLSLANVSGTFWCNNNPNLSGITFASSGNGVVNEFRAYSCNLTGNFNISNINVGGAFRTMLNPNLTGITFASSGNTKLTIFESYSCNLTGSFSLANVPVSGYFDIKSNPNLTSITFAGSGNTQITNFDASNNTGLLALDFTNVPIGTRFSAISCSSLTNIIFASSGNSKLTTFQLQNSNITGVLDLTNVPISYISVGNNPNLSDILFSTTGNTTFTIAGMNLCNLGYVNFTNIIGMLSLNNQNFVISDNNMIADEVNHILVDLYNLVSGEGVGGDYTGRIIYIGGTNANPDGSSGGYDGLTAKSNLEGKGFTVIIT